MTRHGTVLQGTLWVRVGKEVVEAKAGSGSVRAAWNASRPTGILNARWRAISVVMTSNVYSLIQDIQAMALAAVFAKHDSELVKEWSAFTTRNGHFG